MDYTIIETTSGVYFTRFDIVPDDLDCKVSTHYDRPDTFAPEQVRAEIAIVVTVSLKDPQKHEIDALLSAGEQWTPSYREVFKALAPVSAFGDPDEMKEHAGDLELRAHAYIAQKGLPTARLKLVILEAIKRHNALIYRDEVAPYMSPSRYRGGDEFLRQLDDLARAAAEVHESARHAADIAYGLAFERRKQLMIEHVTEMAKHNPLLHHFRHDVANAVRDAGVPDRDGGPSYG